MAHPAHAAAPPWYCTPTDFQFYTGLE